MRLSAWFHVVGKCGQIVHFRCFIALHPSIKILLVKGRATDCASVRISRDELTIYFHSLPLVWHCGELHPDLYGRKCVESILTRFGKLERGLKSFHMLYAVPVCFFGLLFISLLVKLNLILLARELQFTLQPFWNWCSELNFLQEKKDLLFQTIAALYAYQGQILWPCNCKSVRYIS